MNQPSTLFVFRKVFHEDKWHLKCINCSLCGSFIWECQLNSQTPKWLLYFPSSASITIYPPPCYEDTSHILMGPEIVYGKDHIQKSLDPSNGIHAMVSQDECIFITDDNLSNITLPQFLSTEFCSTLVYEMMISFEIPFLEDLPESTAFDKLQRKISAGDRGLEMMLSSQHTRVRIPPGLPMPASIESFGRFVPVVYVIKEWVSENQASVICYASSHLEESKFLSLVREFRESSYRSFVGPTHPEYVVPGSAKDYLHRVLIGHISQCNPMTSIPPVVSVCSAG